MAEINAQIPLAAMGADPNQPQQQMGNALQVFQLKDAMQQRQMQQQERSQQQQALIQEKRTHKKLSAMTDRAAGLFMRYQSLKDQGFSEQSAHAAMQEDWKREIGGLASERFDDGSPLFDQQELGQLGQEFKAGEIGMILPKLMGAKNALDMHFKTRDDKRAEATLAETKRHNQAAEGRERNSETFSNPVDEMFEGKPVRVQYGNRGTRKVIPDTQPMPKPKGGFAINPETGQLEATAGGGGTPIPSEIQARLALGENYAKQVPDLLAAIDQGKSGAVGTMLNVGTSGLIAKRQESGVDALVRNLTGAGKSKEEAESYASRYQFETTDSDKRKREKVLQLVSELKAIDEAVKSGRGWPASTAYGSIDAPKQLSEPAPGTPKGRQPVVGEVRAGYRFKGGSPGDPASWEKQ